MRRTNLFCLTGISNSIAVHRVETLNLLFNKLKNSTKPSEHISVHFSKRITSYTQDSTGVTLHFHDGSSAQADVLVGADGIGSATRKTMYTKLADRARGTSPGQADHLMSHVRLPQFVDGNVALLGDSACI